MAYGVARSEAEIVVPGQNIRADETWSETAQGRLLNSLGLPHYSRTPGVCLAAILSAPMDC